MSLVNQTIAEAKLEIAVLKMRIRASDSRIEELQIYSNTTRYDVADLKEQMSEAKRALEKLEKDEPIRPVNDTADLNLINDTQNQFKKA